jgi:hypothetical protein
MWATRYGLCNKITFLKLVLNKEQIIVLMIGGIV